MEGAGDFLCLEDPTERTASAEVCLDRDVAYRIAVVR